MTFNVKKPVLSYNAEKALVKGIIIGVVSPVSYLLVVAITTPSLPAIAGNKCCYYGKLCYNIWIRDRNRNTGFLN